MPTETPTKPKPERLLDLQNGTAIWRVHLDDINEQPLNARYMPPERMAQLAANIRNEGRMESLPLLVKRDSGDGTTEFRLISGHQRTRAARAAELFVIPFLVIETHLTPDEERAKVLSHNALAGRDDPQILKEIYESIEAIDARIASGILPSDLDYKPQDVAAEAVALRTDYQLVSLVFLHGQKQTFDDVLELIDQNSEVGLCDIAAWERFSDAIRRGSKLLKVKNVTALITKLCDAVDEIERAKNSES